MPKPRVLPSTQDLLTLVDQGMTHAQIANHIYLTTGEIVNRSAISVALSRAGKTKTLPRYKETLPWKVATEHAGEYPARMLRLLGRRNAGNRLTQQDEARLNSWIEMLDSENVIVAYGPEVGFLYVDPDERGDKPDGLPIRNRTITPDEIG